MAIKFRIPTARESWSKWLASNPCPPDKPGAPTINTWIFDAVRACWRSSIRANRVEDLVEPELTRKQNGREIQNAIRRVYDSTYTSTGRKREPKAQYSLSKLEDRASRIDVEITREWLQECSPMRTDITPAAFLHVLYRQGESVWIGTRKHERRGSIWINDSAEDIDCLDCLRSGHQGVWFLANPVTGKPFNGPVNQWFPNGETWRTEASVTSWRYLVIESDKAPEHLWLRMLVQLQLPIVAIYTSGGRSIHSLVRVDQPSKSAWDQYRDSIKNGLVELGADPGSLTAVRLTRLPGCVRGETGQLQELLFLNPMASGNSPIIERSADRVTNPIGANEVSQSLEK
jgi:hypothetical protein